MEKSNSIDTNNKHVKLQFKKGKEKSEISKLFSNKQEGSSSVTKAMSCTELPSGVFKASSEWNQENTNSMFFNEKGWPVKVMRVESSSPTAAKPWPSRSLPSTVCNGTNSRKQKSLYTLHRSALGKKENKENRAKISIQKEDKAEELKDKVEELKKTKSYVVANKSDLLDSMKAVLECVEKSETKSTRNIENKAELERGKTKHLKSVSTNKIQKPVEKVTRGETNGSRSARTNKYNSKEMKAYIQAKRSERKQQFSEELKKKQELLEIQKNNLEKLKETASKVVKKCPKTVEESKPRWQGPLEQDTSETSALGIHIFESNLFKAKKQKLSAKTETSEHSIPNKNVANTEETINLQDEIFVTNNEAIVKVQDELNLEHSENKKVNKNLSMEKENLNTNTEPIDPEKVVFLEDDTVAGPIIEKDYCHSDGELLQTNSAPTDLNRFLPRTSDDCSRRGTFSVSQLSIAPCLMADYGDPKQTSAAYKSVEQAVHRVPAVEQVTPDPAENPKGSSNHEVSIEDALKKVQQQIAINQKHGKDPEWLHTFVQTDAFNMMNVIKMKRLSSRKNNSSESEKRKRLKIESFSSKPSVDDETDAPSIVSLEEEYCYTTPPEPLRLSDIRLPLPSTMSNSTPEWIPHSSVGTFQAVKNVTEGTIKTSMSSFASDAPPLVVPKSLQQLKLKSSWSASSEPLTSQPHFNSCEVPTSESLHRPAAPLDLADRDEPTKLSKSSDEQIEIGQVVSSAPSTRSEAGSHSTLRSIQDMCSNPGTVDDGTKEGFQPPRLSSASLSSSSPKNLNLYKVLIEEARFQKEQYELMARAQEDVLLANYNTALADHDLKTRSDKASGSKSSDKEIEVRNNIETFYRRARAKIRRTKSIVISNYMKRIDDLQREKDALEKQMKTKRYKLRSAESSPKKHVGVQSSTATSVVENSSSSECSFSTKHFDDEKKRHETDSVLAVKQKKVHKEMLRKLYQEEKQKMQDIERTLKLSKCRRDKSTSPLHSMKTTTRDVACSAHEDNHQFTSSSLQSVEEARGTDMYNSESFESPESSETPRQPRVMSSPFVANKPFIAARVNSKSKMLIKVPLSPCMQLCPKRRVSSGSDESLIFSQNETLSEQSDYDVKISALKEQKRQRQLILDRLHRELKKAQKELLKATEASLIKQIQVYDCYIDETKKQLEQVTEKVSAKKIVRPQIKHPRVSDKFLLRNLDESPKPLVMVESVKYQEAAASDIDTNSLKTVSEVSSTGTAIQSSGIGHVSEQLSPEVEVPKEVIPSHEELKELQSDKRAGDSLHSVASESCKTPSEIISPELCSTIQSQNRASVAVSSLALDSNFKEGENSSSSLCSPLNSSSRVSEALSNVASEISNVSGLNSATCSPLQSESNVSEILSSPASGTTNVQGVEDSSEPPYIHLEPGSKLSDSPSCKGTKVPKVSTFGSKSVLSSPQQSEMEDPEQLSIEAVESSNVSGLSGTNSVLSSSQQSNSNLSEKLSSKSTEASNVLDNEVLITTQCRISKASQAVSGTDPNGPKVEVTKPTLSTSLRSNSVKSDALSNVASETFNNPSLDTSHNSAISEIIEDHSNSENTNAESVEDENQWVDAEEFFDNFEEESDRILQNSLKDTKVGVRILSKQSSSNTSSIVTNITKDDHSVSDNFHNKEISYIDAIPRHVEHLSSTELICDQAVDNHANESLSKNKKSPVQSISEHLGEASEGSVTIQALSPNQLIISNLAGDSNNSEDLSAHGHDSVSESKTKIDTLLTTHTDETISNKSKESQKLDISISSDLNNLSQNSTPVISDTDFIQTEVIEVFVPNKSEEYEDHILEDGKTDILNETYIISTDKKMVLEDNKKERQVDSITDYLLNGLINECFKSDQFKKDSSVENSNQQSISATIQNLNSNSTFSEKIVDNFTDTVLNTFLKDATDCILHIKESNKSARMELNNVSRKMEEESSPNKLLEALALESSKPLLDKSDTTSDLNDSTGFGDYSMNQRKLAEGSESGALWLQEELHPVSLQAQREAEELRIKQLQIELEIKQLEQAQENIPSYYYVREIPNKPPPPYTPPQPQPTRQEDIETLAGIAVHSLVAAWQKGEDITSLQPSDQYSTKRVGCKVYKKFMFDLVKQIFVDITANAVDEKDFPPWERTGSRIRHVVLPKLTEDSITNFILKKVRVLFGCEPSSIKENLIIQWSRKKRDRVDELLVQESQEEEQEWTDYSKYELGVKNSVALSIFDSLIEETSIVLSRALQRKLCYSEQSS